VPPAAASVRPSTAPAPACACGRLRRAARALTQLYDDAMAPSGLRVTQFSLLRTLRQDGPMRISELSARQLIERTALSRNLDPLVERGFVDVSSGRDARTRVAKVTRAGEKALLDATPHWKRAQAQVARMIGADRLDTLIEVLGDLEALHPTLTSNRPGSAPIPQTLPARPSPRRVGRTRA
jgi:DNA-binding MarR family transcriptional regulator